MRHSALKTVRSVATGVFPQSPTLTLLGFALIGVLVIFYIGVTNAVATQGYELGKLQKSIEALKRDNADAELAITAAESLPRISSEAQGMALTSVAHLEYLATAGTAVAVR